MVQNILIAGSSGLVGSRLKSELKEAGYNVKSLVRRTPINSSEVKWDPANNKLDSSVFEHIDAVINLSGSPIAETNWDSAGKENLINSRVNTTRLLAEKMSETENKPSLMINASAVGYYGNRPSEADLSENSKPGSGFLPNLVQKWESATQKAKDSGIKVSSLRFANILSKDGGIIAKLKPLFQIGMTSPLGSGKQKMPWVSLRDVVDSIVHVIKNEDNPNLQGAINVASPQTVDNKEFTQSLSKALNRIACPLPVPEVAIKTTMGEKGQELLLNDVNVSSKKLEDSGFVFKDQDLTEFLNKELS